ncbi:MAG: HDOD domain-containing protein [Verrucomicrobia bacterium]|nr:HDOD domain-containing protein [Verrucomicrobiota bacterium]
MTELGNEAKVQRLSAEDIERRLAQCPALPSLSSISNALRSLLQADQRYTAQISDIVRRDPSLTSRLLRLVNSVYFGLTTPIQSIEEAVFYLGVRQIRQLALVTPIIEDFQRLTVRCAFPWREFWQHCIGVALMTREVIGTVQAPLDEGDYVAGLVHDLGKIVMAWSFPEHFAAIHHARANPEVDLTETELAVLGMDHTQVGSIYMRSHNMPELMIEAAAFHHRPQEAKQHTLIVAAVQIADLLVRNAKIGTSGNLREVAFDECMASPGWQILFPTAHEAEMAIARASMGRSLQQLPSILENLV